MKERLINSLATIVGKVVEDKDCTMYSDKLEETFVIVNVKDNYIYKFNIKYNVIASIEKVL